MGGRGVVGKIKATVKKGNALGDAGKKAVRENGEIVSGLQPQSGGSRLRFKPGLSLAFTGALLEGGEGAGDFTNFVGALRKGDFGFELAGGERLDGIADGPKLADNVDMKEIRGDCKGH